MEIIAQIVEKIDDELKDAKDYIKLAYEVKDKYPSLADAYYKLSIEEMGHATILHEQVVNVINDIKRTNPTIPQGMQMFYDYLHEKQIKKAAKIKAKQDSYK